jgi:hypothetical protein
MRRWLLAAGLIAAAAASPALAADIDGVPPPPPRSGPYGAPYSGPYGSPYDDPRYTPKAPPPSSYYDDDDDRYDGRPPAQKYSYAPPKYAAPPRANTCVRSEEVRDRLTGQGWRDFHDGKPVSEGLVTLRARRPSGRLFELTLHRCSGEILEARPLELRPFGPYAYRQPYGPYGPWRWGPATAPNAYGDNGWQERPYADRGPRRWGWD